MNKNEKPRTVFRRVVALAALVMTFTPLATRAQNTSQMNLGEMYGRAQRVFRGTVIAAVPGKVSVGGGELPTVTYRIRVDESFKGDFQIVKGTRLAEVRMLAMDHPGTMATSIMAGLVSEIPRLEVGRRYLLLTTKPSAIGLSAPVGLGQGCFMISGRGNQEMAVNAHGNRMLFRGMSDAEQQMPNAARSYERLAEIIRGLGQSRR